MALNQKTFENIYIYMCVYIYIYTHNIQLPEQFLDSITPIGLEHRTKMGSPLRDIPVAYSQVLMR